MRKIFLSLSCVILASCETESNIVDYSNKDVLSNSELVYPENFINWNDLLKQSDGDYFAYVFSYDCYYCKELKQKMIKYYYYGNVDLFFIEYSKIIPIDYSIEKTIGATNVDDVFIKGTPTLIGVKNKTIATNVAGKKAVEEIIDLN